MNISDAENYEQRNYKTGLAVIIWSTLWIFSFGIAGVAVNLWWRQNNAVLIISIVVHLACAIGALKAHQLWLRGLDEFQRQIQLHSMAYTLGLTWIAVMFMLLLSSTGTLVIGGSHLAILTLFMAVSGVLSYFIAMRKAS